MDIVDMCPKDGDSQDPDSQDPLVPVDTGTAWRWVYTRSLTMSSTVASLLKTGTQIPPAGQTVWHEGFTVIFLGTVNEARKSVFRNISLFFLPNLNQLLGCPAFPFQ